MDAFFSYLLCKRHNTLLDISVAHLSCTLQKLFYLPPLFYRRQCAVYGLCKVAAGRQAADLLDQDPDDLFSKFSPQVLQEYQADDRLYRAAQPVVLDKVEVVEEGLEAGDMACLPAGCLFDELTCLEGRVPVFSAVIEDHRDDLGHLLGGRRFPFGRKGFILRLPVSEDFIVDSAHIAQKLQRGPPFGAGLVVDEEVEIEPGGPAAAAGPGVCTAAVGQGVLAGAVAAGTAAGAGTLWAAVCVLRLFGAPVVLSLDFLPDLPGRHFVLAGFLLFELKEHENIGKVLFQLLVYKTRIFALQALEMYFLEVAARQHVPGKVRLGLGGGEDEAEESVEM